MGKQLVRQAMDHLGKDWSKSSLTRDKLLGNTKEFAHYVEVKYGLAKIENLKPHMIEAYVRDLKERGLSASTLAGKMTAVRSVAQSIGKANIVARENKEYGIERIRINPQQVDHGKISEIRTTLQNRAEGGDRTAKMMFAACSLRESFGLRTKESLMSKDVVERGGKLFLVVDGAKGGRPRELEVRTEAQIKSVQLIAETSKSLGSGTGRIIPPEMSLKQAYGAQRNEWRALGGTRGAGANMHGSRHGVARELHKDGKTNAEIMVTLGHGEDRSPAAYIPKT